MSAADRDRVTIDLRSGEVLVELEGGEQRYALASPEAFAAVSRAWLRCGWDTKYVYSFTWLGRPIIQLPEDIVRLQELVVRAQPDVIVETGVAHGGSLMLYASLCRAAGRGRVIGVDVEIRSHNRVEIEGHALAPLITLVDGSSTAEGTIEEVKGLIGPDERVMVVLDSVHTREHVLAELEAYAPLVGHGSFVVAMDGIMEQLSGAPRTGEDWASNNPRRAVDDFVAAHPEFEVVEPPFAFNEGVVTDRVTYFPGGILERVPSR
jgi:cephalosporin hydroxylase